MGHHCLQRRWTPALFELAELVMSSLSVQAPTLAVNFHGTLALIESCLPLLDAGEDARLVNVASMAGRLGQLSPTLQADFSSPSLTLPALRTLVAQFEAAVAAGTHERQGWGRSNYGFSKLALIAATRVLAREHPNVKVRSTKQIFRIEYRSSLTLP